MEHIRLGIQAAAEDPEAMLLFSGGQTRLAAGPRSEVRMQPSTAHPLDYNAGS